jgi:hypothetical protein
MEDREMTKQEMIDRVIKGIESHIGFHYSPETVSAIIEAGTIPEGYVLTTRVDQVAKYEAGNINVYTSGTLTKTVKAEGMALEGALMQYASNASRLGSSMGSPNMGGR